jgi:hypothetical protein
LDRSLHPLFPLQISIVFRAELTDPSLASFRQRIVEAVPSDEELPHPELTPGSKLFPDKIRDAVAYTLLTADLQAKVFFIRKAASPALSPDREDPNLSFSLKVTNSPSSSPNAHKVESVSSSRSYGYSRDGVITIYFPYETINASDCYSDGQMISTSDLLGSRMRVHISPSYGIDGKYGPAVEATFESMELDLMDIIVPGDQEIQLHKEDFKRHGYEFEFTFPETKDDLSKLFAP